MSRGRLKLVSRRYALPTRLEPAPVAGRVPPHDLDAEAVVLSAILLSRDALDRVLESLKPEHFYSDANGRIYMAAQDLAAMGKPVDISTVASWLRDREWIQHIGGPSYLTQIADATPAVGNVAAHASVVYEKWRVRQLIAQCQRIASEGYGDVGDVQEFINASVVSVNDLTRGHGEREMVGMKTLMKSVWEQAEAASMRVGGIPGIPTGYDRLDQKIGGLEAGNVYIFAARPGMGKSALVGNIAVNVASDSTVKERAPGDATTITERVVPGHGVCFFQLEMPQDQVGLRLAGSEARIDLCRLKNGWLQPDDWRRLSESCTYIQHLPIFIDDTPAIGLTELRSKIRRKQAEFNRPATSTTAEKSVALVIVDYLQLMKGRDDAQNREQQIAEISRGLKVLAKEVGVAVIALSQLNRAVETRSTKDKRPQLSDLRESGSVEQDADAVIFIYRDEYYNPETTNAKGIAELIIAKQRNGPTGKVLVRFSASCTRFDNLAAGDYPEMQEDE